jgi:hypothetical protein
MGSFRPSRTVTGPAGDYWELYVSKTALPRWREGAGGDWQASGDGRFDLLTLPLALPGIIWSVVLSPLLRFLVLLPVAVVRGRRSRAVRVEAVNNFPVREVYLWTTTTDLVDNVLEEIATGLKVGRFVQPAGAVYSGRLSA